MTRSFDIVVACDLNCGIGKHGQLPWKLAGDMKHFRELTSSASSANLTNAVIMGRKTWQSLPEKFRPLPGRLNVVITRDANYPLPEGVSRASSLDHALKLVDKVPVDRCFVIGGAEIYAQAISHDALRRIYLTEVKSVFDCDTFFPDYRDRFIEISTSETFCDGDIEYSFKVLQRRGAEMSCL